MGTATKIPLLNRTRQFWHFWCEVNTDEPVRRTLNQTLAKIIAALTLVAIPQIFIGIATNQPGTVITIISLPILFGIWWINRRGTSTGAIAFSALLTIVITTAFEPRTFFVDDYTVIHAGFLLPIVTAIFFVVPRAGIFTTLGIIVGLSYRVLDAGFGDKLPKFIFFASTNLVSIAAIMMYVATILIRHINGLATLNIKLATVNDELATVNNELEERVSIRTAQLEEAKAFIERRAAERAQQVAAVVHDLRHTGVAADAILSLLELDVEDAEIAVNDIKARLTTVLNQVTLDENGAVAFKATPAALTIDNEKSTIAAPEDDILATFITVFNTAATQTLALVTTSTDGKIIHRPLPTTTLIETMPVYSDVASPLYATASIITSTTIGAGKSSEHDEVLATVFQAGSATICLLDTMQTLITNVVKADADIRTSMESQRGLLSDMLDMAELEAAGIKLRPAVVDFGAIAEKVIRLLAPQATNKHCELHLIADNSIAIYCDVARLERVLHNVIGNAIKYTSAFRGDSKGQIHVKVAREGERAICRVSDNGPGIATEDLAWLGQRFRRAERTTAGATGTGLGLHFCKGVLEASGGELRIESDGVGLGSCVSVVVPIPPACSDKIKVAEETIGDICTLHRVH